MISPLRVKKIINDYETLEKELSTGQLNKKDYVAKSKEYSILSEIMLVAKSYIAYEKNKSELEILIEDKKNDIEMSELAKKELYELNKKHNKDEKDLKLFLLPKDEADNKNAIVEIRAGTGGLEASIFASDLFKMYEKVSSLKGWQMEIISLSKSEAQGFKEVITLVKGKNVYSKPNF